jgi:hypothetical protein
MNMRRTVLAALVIAVEVIARIALFQVNHFLGSVLIGNAIGNVLFALVHCI